ncbi:12711_t:CDS:2, partial [Ambispora leptoticha]
MPVKIVARRSEDRGYANHGWLDTHHTFSFASYYDSQFQGLGSLRVINEDKVEPQSGFGTHSHREFEIFSYIISGELEHRDSIGNVEILKRGDVQFTTAGTGISHSEYNVHPSLPVHFLQIWVKPDTARLTPEYHTKSLTDNEKTNSLVHIIAPASNNNSSTIGIHTDFNMYASILEPDHSVKHVVQGEGNTGRRLYVHLTNVGGQIKVLGKELLKQGDGAFLTDALPGEEILFENVGVLIHNFGLNLG